MFLFYSNLLMGEFTRSNRDAKTFFFAVRDVFTIANLVLTGGVSMQRVPRFPCFIATWSPTSFMILMSATFLYRKYQIFDHGFCESIS